MDYVLYNIIAYKQLQYIATYFSSKDFVLTRQLQFKHAGLERYTVSLLNNTDPEFRCVSWPSKLTRTISFLH